MKICFAVLLVLLVPLVTSINATFECPEIVYFDEEFVCTVDVQDIDDVYDVKFYITNDDGGINRIFDGSEFRRADWYLKEWISEEDTYDIRLIIHKEYVGPGDGQFKLRDSSGKIKVFETFEIEVGESSDGDDGDSDSSPDDESSDDESDDDNSNQENEAEEDTRDEKEKDDRRKKEKKDFESLKKLQDKESSNQVITSHASKKVINLNGEEEIKDAQTVVYKSSQERIREIMMYAFVGFLIIVICVLLFEKTWQRQRYERL